MEAVSHETNAPKNKGITHDIVFSHHPSKRNIVFFCASDLKPHVPAFLLIPDNMAVWQSMMLSTNEPSRKNKTWVVIKNHPIFHLYKMHGHVRSYTYTYWHFD